MLRFPPSARLGEPFLRGGGTLLNVVTCSFCPRFGFTGEGSAVSEQVCLVTVCLSVQMEHGGVLGSRTVEDFRERTDERFGFFSSPGTADGSLTLRTTSTR